MQAKRVLRPVGVPVEACITEVPDWFTEAGFDRCPQGWKPKPIEFVPYRFVLPTAAPENRLMAIITGATEADGKRWVHVSYSRPSRMPSYFDGVQVKRDFLGPERKAIAVFAPEDEHVSIHSYCLHLWHCVDGDGLPDFRRAGQI